MNKFALALIILADAAVSAETPLQMKPGLWEYNVTIEIPGMPFAMPAVKREHCLTQKDVESGDLSKGQNENKQCQVSNLKQGEGAVSYDIACTGNPQINGHYDFKVAETSMEGTGTMNMAGQTMKNKLSATRLGDCK